MAKDRQTTTCSQCGTILDPIKDKPCPKCGSNLRHINIELFEEIQVNDKVSVSTIKEYCEKRPKIAICQLIIWLGSAIVGFLIGNVSGFVIGTVLGGLAFILPPYLIKYRTKETFS